MFDDSQTTPQNNDTTTMTPTMGLGGTGQIDATPTVPQVVLPEHLAAQQEEVSTPSKATGLDEIKQKALSQLSPLIHKLDQTPEEKYKTLMMMIQASDNQELLNEAYEAAQAITDEKAKAEALLSVVNEINYFMQGK